MLLASPLFGQICTLLCFCFPVNASVCVCVDGGEASCMCHFYTGNYCHVTMKITICSLHSYVVVYYYPAAVM